MLTDRWRRQTDGQASRQAGRRQAGKTSRKADCDRRNRVSQVPMYYF